MSDTKQDKKLPRQPPSGLLGKLGWFAAAIAAIGLLFSKSSDLRQAAEELFWPDPQLSVSEADVSLEDIRATNEGSRFRIEMRVKKVHTDFGRNCRTIFTSDQTPQIIGDGFTLSWQPMDEKKTDYFYSKYAALMADNTRPVKAQIRIQCGNVQTDWVPARFSPWATFYQVKP